MTAIEDRLRKGLTDTASRIRVTADLDSVLGGPPARPNSTPGLSHPTRARVLAVAAVALLVGLAITLAARTLGHDTTPATSGRASTPLLVLPAPGSPYVINNGYIRTSSPPLRPVPSAGATHHKVIVGTQDGQVFTNLMRVSLTDGRPEPVTSNTAGAPANEWTETDDTGRSIWVMRDPDGLPAVVVAQDRSDRWISIETRPAAEQQAKELLAEVRVDGAERDRLSFQPDVRVLADVTPPTVVPDTPTISTGYEMSGDGIDGFINVETVNHTDVLSAAVYLTDTVEPTTVNDASAWILTRPDETGEWHGLVWSPTPGTSVAISGTTSINRLRSVATSLRVVDQAAWDTALPTANKTADRN